MSDDHGESNRGGLQLHLVSWNVASWMKALSYIRKHHGSLTNWMDKHNIDILCLQEVKTLDKNLEQDPSSLGALTPTLDTFWAPARGDAKKCKGFNGVATFARKGLTLSAEREVLGSGLDHQGRCILTRHQRFVIFNVYVPNDGPWSRALPGKMKFLNALAEAMQRERDKGYGVILAGDLNLQLRNSDCHWSRRILNVPKFLNIDVSNGSKQVKEAQEQLRNGAWESVQKTLLERKFRTCVVNASLQRKKVEKWRVVVKGRNGEDVFLGRPFESEDQAKGSNDDYRIEGRKLLTEDGELEARPPDEISVTQLAECIKIATGTEWPIALQKELSEDYTTSRSSPCVLEWATRILSGRNKMVDSFSELWPEHRARFTCWNQYKNKRYQNAGARIDYFFVDQNLFRNVIRGEEKMFGDDSRTDRTEKAALNACTAFGRWKMAPFEGGGLPNGTQSDYDSQFYKPHTGMIYTPPQFSDHIAVSLLMQFKEGMIDKSKPLKLSTKKTTKDCQPHKKQMRISSFFSSRNHSHTSSIQDDKTGFIALGKRKNNSQTGEVNDSRPRKQKPKGILAFFGKKA